ncbi:unnamed protein product [Heterobilharzia americana]|nr:unnamed protein product [Heterobilharzia americana]
MMIAEVSREESLEESVRSEASSSKQNSDEGDDRYLKKFLDDFWGPETADYFLHPNFQKSSSVKPKDKESTNLKPWLFDIPTNERRRDKSSIKRRLSVFYNNNQHFRRASRAKSACSLIDLLKLHLGENLGAHHLWDLLRRKSYEKLTDFEKSLTKEDQFTFAAFTHEYISCRNKKPPLCDFVRENPSYSLTNVINNLKAPEMEKQLRKVNLAISWANRNQDQFRIISFQQDLKDAIKSIEEGNFSSTVKNHVMNNFNPNIKVNRQKADELVSLCPSLKNKQYSTFIDRNLQPLENYFPEYCKTESRVKQKDKTKIKMLAKKPEERIQQNSVKKQDAVLSKHSKSTIPSISSSIESKLQPLCWSDLITQMKQTCLDDTSRNDNINESESYNCFVKKTLWKPANSIAS